jgi:NhaP-type Na+/H+ or K+/H+ antiporter
LARWPCAQAGRGARRHRPRARLLFTVVLALAILGASGLTRTDGVLAVFVGGLAFNLVSTGPDRTDELSMDEAVNRFAVLPLFVVLGAVLPWGAWRDLGWSGLVLAVAVLLLRRLPVLLLLASPLRLRLRDALYLGWFGPIGVSALFYLTLEAKRLQVPEVVLPPARSCSPRAPRSTVSVAHPHASGSDGESRVGTESGKPV